MKDIITETEDRTHKQSMRFFCLLFYRKTTLSEVCWASRAPVTSLVAHTRFAVGFTRWHSADRKLQVANRRSISNLYQTQTQVWYLKISDLGEAEVWYLVVNERLKVHYVGLKSAERCFPQSRQAETSSELRFSRYCLSVVIIHSFQQGTMAGSRLARLGRGFRGSWQSLCTQLTWLGTHCSAGIGRALIGYSTSQTEPSCEVSWQIEKR